MVKHKFMIIKRLISKYVVILLIYTVIIRFIKPYGLNLYYTMIESPNMFSETVQTVQSVMLGMMFFINLIIVIIILFDSKSKKTIDWLIALVTFFSVETGILIFLFWQTYKETIKKYEAQQKI